MAAVAATSKGCAWNQDMAGLLAELAGVVVHHRQDALGSLVTLVEARRLKDDQGVPDSRLPGGRTISRARVQQ